MIFYILMFYQKNQQHKSGEDENAVKYKHKTLNIREFQQKESDHLQNQPAVQFFEQIFKTIQPPHSKNTKLETNYQKKNYLSQHSPIGLIKIRVLKEQKKSRPSIDNKFQSAGPKKLKKKTTIKYRVESEQKKSRSFGSIKSKKSLSLSMNKYVKMPQQKQYSQIKVSNQHSNTNRQIQKLREQKLGKTSSETLPPLGKIDNGRWNRFTKSQKNPLMRKRKQLILFYTYEGQKQSVQAKIAKRTNMDVIDMKKSIGKIQNIIINAPSNQGQILEMARQAVDCANQYDLGSSYIDKQKILSNLIKNKFSNSSFSVLKQRNL